MCGISGIIQKDALSLDDRATVDRINSLLIHRGPDGQGVFESDRAMLAMRRLSIIDLSTGWQPLYNEDRSLALVCNGEIYNFIELRQELKARGHTFTTHHNDCETILHLYEEYGDDCVQHLRGMFAFALWDSRKRRVLLARDRMGEKPLYLATFPGRIVFASELKALVGAGVVPFQLDPTSIDLYFHYGYVPEPRAAVLGVRKLPAAHVLSIEVDHWKVEQRCYWRMLDAPPIDADPAATIRAELERVSEMVVRSDVPVGVALSGGLDSSVIAALAARKYPGKMEAISIGYPGRPRQDERRDAQELATHLGLPFHEVELSDELMIESLPRIMHERDDPIGDLSGSAYYFVLKRAREMGVPVMLSGHGGDELFWGYGWVRHAVLATERKLRTLSGATGLGDYLQLQRPPKSYTGGLRWLKSLAGLRTGWQQYRRDRLNPGERMVFYDLEPPFREAEQNVRALYESRWSDGIDSSARYAPFTISQPWPQIDLTMTRLICETYMLENGLAQGDRLSMASSVELRLPLVDYRLVETVIGLRKAHRDIDLGPKRWLRDAVAGLVPEFVLKRPKRGFSPPWRIWARSLSEAYGHDLRDGFLVQEGVFSKAGAASAADNISPGAFGVHRISSERAVLLELWCRAMRDAAKPVHQNQPKRPARAA